jgi:hypothetical protein
MSENSEKEKFEKDIAQKQSSFKKYFDIFVLKNPFQSHWNYSKQVKKIFQELKKT